MLKLPCPKIFQPLTQKWFHMPQVPQDIIKSSLYHLNFITKSDTESHLSAVSDILMLHKQPANYLTPQLFEYLLCTEAKADLSIVC